DSHTGLTWELKVEGTGSPDYTNPRDKSNVYAWYSKTNHGGYPGYDNDTINTTQEYLQALNSIGPEGFGGYKDWRLPTRLELMTLLDYRSTPPATQGINPDLFPNLSHDIRYWTSETATENSTLAIATTLDPTSASISQYPKNDTCHVVAVRGGVAPLSFRFSDNENDTVTDTLTGLMWQKTAAGPASGAAFDEAIKHCEELELAGYTDWRLPNILELRSLLTPGKTVSEQLYDELFSESNDGGAFASSTSTEPPVKKLSIAFKGSGSLSLRFRAVRGGDMVRRPQD
ncbi:MAG: DUF1566 domain-containing protein, partial [Desulfovibrionales bacterium]|nr:DUF1566 domain-containing protein [Desulfovibrionales bacterium]